MKKKFCYLFILTVSCFAGELSPKAKHAQDKISNVDKLVEECLNVMGVPGASVGIVVDGDVIVSKGYGHRDAEKKNAVTTKTLFPIGSSTKAFTTFLLGQLVDEGVLDWDDPVAEHIPHFKLNDPYTTYEITIRDYLTHISGYPLHDAMWYNSDLSRKEVIQRLRYLEPFAPYREKFLYQNLGYMIAAHAAENATGKTWEDLVKEKILQPLNMIHTNFSIADLKKYPDRAVGFRENLKRENCLTQYIDIPQVAAAGAINSNLEDMLKWIKVLLKKGDGLIEERTWDEISSPQVISDLILNGRYGAEGIVQMESYGLGWVIISYRGHVVLMHGGNIEGFSSNVMIMPQDGIALVVLTNKHNTPLPYLLATTLIDRLLDLEKIDWLQKYKNFVDYTKDTFEQNQHGANGQRHEGTAPSHDLCEFQGNYFHPAYGTIEVRTKDDQLEAVFHKDTLPLNHYHYDVFDVSAQAANHRFIGLKFTFSQNEYGDIASVSFPFEPLVEDIVFMKQQDERFSHEKYLDRFAGNYSYHGFGFNIERNCDKLIVHALGQPPFELIPVKDGIFKVKDFDGYTVQFTSDDKGQVTAVQLVQPNNISFTATKY